MIKVICDKCGSDCDREGYEIRVNAIHNPVPLYPTDTGDLTITEDRTSMRFILCRTCYKKMGLPNIYSNQKQKKVIWREEK